VDKSNFSSKKRILITGATGTLGKALVPLIGDTHQMRFLSRKPRPDQLHEQVEWFTADLGTGKYLDQALMDVQIVVHAASDSSNPEEVDQKGTKYLVEAARKAGVEHIIYPSIVGIDSIPMKYYQVKREAEEIIIESGIPWSILRATQFHSLIDHSLKFFNKIPGLMLIPKKFKFQTVDSMEVAQRIHQCIKAGPGKRLPDFGGPEVLTLEEIVRIWQEVRNERKWLINLPIPGKTARAFRNGFNTSEDHKQGARTWREWLTLHYAKRNRQSA